MIMAPPAGSRLDRIYTDESGLAAIEFAISAPVIVMLLMMLVETAYLLAGGILLEAGARAASRYALTGQSVDGETRVDAIRRIVTRYVCPLAQREIAAGYCFWDLSSTDPNDGQANDPLSIESRVYGDPTEFGRPEPYGDTNPINGQYDEGEPFTDVNGNGHWDADMARSGAGGSGDFVIYHLTMPQHVANPLFRMALGKDSIWHSSVVSVQNEAF